MDGAVGRDANAAVAGRHSDRLSATAGAVVTPGVLLPGPRGGGLAHRLQFEAVLEPDRWVEGSRLRENDARAPSSRNSANPLVRGGARGHHGLLGGGDAGGASAGGRAALPR